MSYNVRSVFVEDTTKEKRMIGKRHHKREVPALQVEQRLVFVPRKKAKDKIRLLSCPKNQMIDTDDIWKKYKNNVFRSVDGKLFKTKKEMQMYNRMFTPKVIV